MSEPTPTPAEVVATFSRLTGIRFQWPPFAVQRQAHDFVKHGFTLADLELVILWVQRQIKHGRSGYTSSCYQWRRLFGEHGAADEFQVFQERLGLAETDRKRGWHPKLSSQEDKETRRQGDKGTNPPEPQDTEEERARRVQKLAEWRQSQRP